MWIFALVGTFVVPFAGPLMVESNVGPAARATSGTKSPTLETVKRTATAVSKATDLCRLSKNARAKIFLTIIFFKFLK